MYEVENFNIRNTNISVSDPYAPNKYLKLVDLGTEYTAELKEDISSGKFEKAIVGGYLTINGHVYYFAHPNYWLNTGDTACTTNHMAVVPAGILGTGIMNSSHTTDGAYVNSYMRSSSGGLNTVADIIKNDFGSDNILSHRSYLGDGAQNGKQTSVDWYNSDVELMNEAMLLGSQIMSSANDGTGDMKIGTADKTQLKLFAERPDLIAIREKYWLRDIGSNKRFVYIDDDGCVYFYPAANSYGIRPVFGIC